MRKALILAAIAVAAAGTAFAADKPDWRKPAGAEWPMRGGDWGNTRYSTLDKINTSNVKQLGGAWVTKFDGSSRATPVVEGGMMFVTAGANVYGLDAKTGKIVWTYKPDLPPSSLFKGVAAGEGKVFVGLANAGMVALDEKTGKLVWEGSLGDNLPNRPQNIASALTTTGQFITGAPVYANGLVVAGMSGGDFGYNGRVGALDAKTGKLVWRFNVIPEPGEKGHDTWPQDSDAWKRGGGAVWMEPAVDPDLGLVYVGTGNPIPQWSGQVRAGDNLYTDTALALDLKTGKLRWYFQTVHHDIWEMDLGTPFVLFDVIKDGKVEKAIGIMRTDGYLFKLDRATGKPITPVEERPVPQNARLKTSPTQPYPVGVEQIGPNCVDKSLVPSAFKTDCYFDPIDSDEPNMMTPLNNTRSAPMAYDPTSARLYVTAHVAPFWIKPSEEPIFVPPGNAPGVHSYGLITAFDAHAGKIIWQKHTPYSIENGSGATASAGGLMFHGEPDGNFQAYDAKSGDLLWQFQTGSNESGPATLYEIDGEEYVAVLATNALWSFKLGGTVQPLPAPTPPPTVTSLKGRVVSADHVTMSAVLNDMGLEDKPQHYTDEYAFAPQRIKVKAGTKVVWTNDGKLPHDATAADGSWTTGEVKPGQTGSVTFDRPGTYEYVCKDHPWSYGEIVVEQ